MMRKIAELPFSLSASLDQNLDPYDLSRCPVLMSQLILTGEAVGAGDTLDVHFQETPDGIQWNSRMRHTLQLGNAGATPAAPRSEEIMLYTRGWPVASPDTVVTPSGSAGATPLPAGSVRHGVLLGRRPLRAPTYRVHFVVAGAGPPAFTGVWTLWVDSNIEN